MSDTWIVIGRNNWLLVGSSMAGDGAARLMSLKATCKENRVEPWGYLKDVLSVIPRGRNVQKLLRDAWLAANRKRWHIADQR